MALAGDSQIIYLKNMIFKKFAAHSNIYTPRV
jgi:hypothetical protein